MYWSNVSVLKNSYDRTIFSNAENFIDGISPTVEDMKMLTDFGLTHIGGEL